MGTRLFLVITSLFFAGLVAAACSSETVEVEKVIEVDKVVQVEKEVEVEKPVIVEKVIEKVITKEVVVVATPTPAPKPPADAGGGTLVVAQAQEPLTMFSAISRVATSRNIGGHIGSRLIQENAQGEILPDLATGWTVSGDGTKVTFKIRTGAKFHDGTPVNAPNIEWFFDMLRNKDHPNHVNSGTFNFIIGATLKQMTAVDDTTLEAELFKPTAALFSQLYFPAMIVESPEAIKTLGEDYGKSSKDWPLFTKVGSGPFSFNGWERGQRMIIEKYPGYWDPAVLDRIIWVWIGEEAAREAALKSGTVDVVEGAITPALAQNFEKTDGLQVFRNPKHGNLHIGLNSTTVEAFKDLRVRQALNYAINKEAIVKDLLSGEGTVSSGPLGPAYGAYYNKDAAPYPHDPAKAKELLAAAGYGSGLSVELLVNSAGMGFGDPRPLVAVLQSDLKNVGVEIKPQIVETGGFNPVFYGKKSQAALFSWSFPIMDPHNATSAAFVTNSGALNTTAYSNPSLDPLMNEALGEFNVEKRIKLYHEIQTKLRDDAPYVWLAYLNTYAAASDKIQGISVFGTGFVNYSKAWIK